ncbi:MAG: protease [Frankiaceae bacterium]|jgi:protease-4|nr:protease [Frankiaceae bacterium]
MHRSHSPLLLELDLTQPLVEVEPDDPIAKLRSRNRPRLKAVLRTLYDAGSDPGVGGLIAKVGNPAMALAQAQEIRDAVRAFTASGKPTFAWAETYGENTPASVTYYLASAFGEVWLQASGEVNLLGVAMETRFLRGLLDKLGVVPELGQRYEYKNAADRILRTEMTDAHREAYDRLAASAWEQIVAGIAESRGIGTEAVQQIADRAPVSAADAVTAGLVDHVGYRDEVYAAARRAASNGGDVSLLFADKWSKPEKPVAKVVRQVRQRKAPAVALVEAHGGIAIGRSRRGAQGPTVGSDTVAAQFRAAVRDDNVKAIVFRVDSPGGSYVASDTIWREVVCARDAGKPVVVSMGALAGSGGYFVACPADIIVAQPGTLTGSIGVLGGKAVLTGLTDKLGLSYDSVQRGEHARMYSAHEPFSDSERERLDAFLDAVYVDFTTKVAQGRGMTREAVHEVARGRVWTGADARGNGLVDELGGLRDALRIARQRAGLSDDAPLRPAVSVPPLARLKPAKSSDDPRAAATVSLAMSGWGDLADIATALGFSSLGPLVMSGVRAIRS